MTAASAARLLIENIFQFRSLRPQRIHLAVVTESGKTPPTVSYQWRRMNMFGVTFANRNAAAAEAWAFKAICAGYLPYHLHRKNGSGHCPREVAMMIEQMKEQA